MASLIGQTVSHYKILERLGGGGMGIVYKAEDTHLHRIVALKFLPPALSLDPDAKARFKQEAEAASALDHPNICNIHDIDETADGQLFISMTCYEGETLKRKLERGPLKLEETLDIGLQVAQGLAEAHRHGIVHRDIKPANIMVTNDGLVKILDFGIAKLCGATMLTRTGMTMGTVAYMAPEQARNEEVNGQTDIWSLGVVLYEMLVGKKPFQSDYEQALVYAILNEEPKPIRLLRADVPSSLEDAIKTALAKGKEVRYESVEELASALSAIGKPTQTGRATSRAGRLAGEKRARHTFRLLVVGGVIILVLAALLIVRPVLLDEAIASKPLSVMLVSFDNQTGEESFDHLRNVIPNLLMTGLMDSRHFRVITWEKIRSLMRQIGKDSAKYIDRETGLYLCRKMGVDILGSGQFTRAGNLFLTELHLLDARTGEVLKTPIAARGTGVESFLAEDGIINELTSQFSDAGGVSVWNRKTSSKPINHVTTNSLEAYSFYLRGTENFNKWYYPEARSFFQKAVELDSTFAMAHFYLSVVGAGKEARHKAIVKAYVYCQNATETERLAIEAAYAFKVEHNMDKMFTLRKLRAERHPFDAEARNELAYSYDIYMGDKDRSLKEFMKAVELDSTNLFAMTEIAVIHLERRDFDKARHYAKLVEGLSPGDVIPLGILMRVALAEGNLDQAIDIGREIESRKPGAAAYAIAYAYALKEDYREAKGWLKNRDIMTRGWLDYWTGRYSGCLKELRLKLQGPLEIKGGVQSFAAWVALETGDLKGCVELQRAAFDERMHDYPQFHAQWTIEYELCRAYVDLRQGFADSAMMRWKAMKEVLPDLKPNDVSIGSDPGLKRYHLNLLLSEILLAKGKPDSAIAVSDSLVLPEVAPNALHCIPSRWDVRARAFVSQRKIDSAIAEYERLATFDARSTDRRLIHPDYHFRLAQLYERKGLEDKAIAQFKKFLEIFRDADPGLREPVEARKALARLQSRP